MSASAAGALELLPGSRLGRYEVRGPIAVGATGAVYRAQDVETGAEVAVKRMLEPAQRERFEIEIRLLSHLSHPRVVRILDRFIDDDAVAIVMELVEGKDLARVLWDRGRPGLPLSSAISWTCETCEALQYVHDQQVVHGDVKPRNLMLGPDGVVLTDFGIASRIVGKQAATAATAGTPRFMAPEVFAGDPVSPASDVYGVAATTWNLLTGAPPVYGDDTPLAETVDGVTPELEEALRTALALDPAQRTQSATELAHALGVPLGERRGAYLAASLAHPGLPRALMEEIVRAAASVFEAAAASIALVQEPDGDLLYVAAWGAGADETVGMRIAPSVGVAGAVAESGEPQAVASCRSDPRFAERVAEATGYVPHTMLVLPLRSGGRTVGVLSVLDRRDGQPYLFSDVPRGSLFCDLATAALDVA